MLDINNFYIDPRDISVTNVRTALATLDAADRDVIYTGLSFSIADSLSKLDKLSEDINVSLVVMNIVNVINEIAIIDRPLFTSKLRTAIEFRIDMLTNNLRDDTMFDSFCGFLKITSYFSNSEIAIIDSKIELFKTTYNHGKSLFLPALTSYFG